MKLTLLLSLVAASTATLEDFHYPSAEAAEREAHPAPQLLTVTPTQGTFSSGGKHETVRVGGQLASGWRLQALLASADTAVLQFDHAAWGQIAFVAAGAPASAALTLRKALGALPTIAQPHFNFSGADPDYFKKLAAGPEDLATTLAMAKTVDGEPDYTSLASQLAPQRDTVAISTAPDVVKFAVSYSGRIKCAARDHGEGPPLQGGGIVELQDQTLPAPNKQLVVFDPSKLLKSWPKKFENTKTGLVGGSLPIANIGAFSSSSAHGFELVAFSPQPTEKPSTSSDLSSAAIAESESACAWVGPFANSYVAGVPPGGEGHFTTLEAAKAACAKNSGCGGVDKIRASKGGTYEMRSASFVQPSTFKGEEGWLITNASKASCHPLPPRIAGINYAPEVYVSLREQSSATEFGSTKYYKVSNATALANASYSVLEVSAEEFYSHMQAHAKAQSAVLSEAMAVTLPFAEGARQADMANSGMLSSLNNFVGDQSNYGFGATYWSYGREDNGSLPLNWLSVDEALVEWGACGVTKKHLSFFFDNYAVRGAKTIPSTINYYSWNGKGDSVGDTGRLIDLFLRTTRLCRDPAFAAKYLPIIEEWGRLSLQARADVTSKPGVPKEAAGLLQGAPEHDWFNVQKDYFYNNNVWICRGMAVLGWHLQADPKLNQTLAKALLADAAKYRSDIASSVKLCLIPAKGKAMAFLPPYAKMNTTPYTSMTTNREASYSNFRFYSEPLLAEVLPAEIEALFLRYHNELGGRTGGASRWQTHLDDMPTAGWGFGALTNNKTTDFLALLYGHAANYQSRGSFHSTEQLSFYGEGLYRDFNTFTETPVGQDGGDGESSLPRAPEAARMRSGSGYYGSENDISFCIVSEILVARMTRWQLILEDSYRSRIEGRLPAIHLGRGAPKRWFGLGGGKTSKPTGPGFAVANAPTSFGGRISFRVSVPQAHAANYSVAAGSVKPGSVRWTMRWPGTLGTQADPVVHFGGCKVLDVDSASGEVAVLQTAPNFWVHSSWH